MSLTVLAETYTYQHCAVKGSFCLCDKQLILGETGRQRPKQTNKAILVIHNKYQLLTTTIATPPSSQGSHRTYSHVRGDSFYSIPNLKTPTPQGSHHSSRQGSLHSSRQGSLHSSNQGSNKSLKATEKSYNSKNLEKLNNPFQNPEKLNNIFKNTEKSKNIEKIPQKSENQEYQK